MSGTPEKNKANFSDLLAELAGEATIKSRAQESVETERQARDAALHAALNKLFKFFNQFCNHLNQIKPAIPRVYGSSVQIVYDQLSWREGFTDYRKQSMADNALLDHVLLRIKLSRATPPEIKRRWYQLDTLLRDATRQEIFSVQLDSDLSVRLHFQGNYETGGIDLLCTNLEDFGSVAFNLTPEQITTPLLDELGRFLMGRSNVLPDALNRTRHIPQHTATP